MLRKPVEDPVVHLDETRALPPPWLFGSCLDLARVSNVTVWRPRRFGPFNLFHERRLTPLNASRSAIQVSTYRGMGCVGRIVRLWRSRPRAAPGHFRATPCCHMPLGTCLRCHAVGCANGPVGQCVPPTRRDRNVRGGLPKGEHALLDTCRHGDRSSGRRDRQRETIQGPWLHLDRPRPVRFANQRQVSNRARV